MVSKLSRYCFLRTTKQTPRKNEQNGLWQGAVVVIGINGKLKQNRTKRQLIFEGVTWPQTLPQANSESFFLTNACSPPAFCSSFFEKY